MLIITEQLLFQTDKSSYQRRSIKKVFAVFTGKRLCWSLFCYEVKKRLQHMFSCEYCEIPNNTRFEEHLRTVDSENDKKRFHGKATGHHDYYMINMGNQRPKIGGKWPLTSHYFQCWSTTKFHHKAQIILQMWSCENNHNFNNHNNLSFIRIWPQKNFSEGCSWLINLGLALGLALNFYTKELKLKVRDCPPFLKFFFPSPLFSVPPPFKVF